MNINLEFKVSLQEHCVRLVNEKIGRLKQQIDARKNDLETASKSSAGDKHETSRAMIHLEQEKLGFQYMEVEKQSHLLSQIEVSVHSIIKSGSLIVTEKAVFYISVGLGMVRFNEQDIYIISPISPLAQAFLNSNSKSIQFQTTNYTILSLV